MKEGGTDAEYVDYVSSRLPQLRRAAFLLCGDWSRGDDIVQKALTDVYVKWGKVRRADDIDAYVRTVLVHRYIDERRSQRRVRLLDEVPDGPQMIREDTNLRLDLQTTMGQLPPRQRSVLVLRFLCDMSVEQTAIAMSCSAGTVKSQTFAALASMRRLLDVDQREMI
jgi:RNA polymerase sigma-70 factor (sigma-E family)